MVKREGEPVFVQVDGPGAAFGSLMGRKQNLGSEQGEADHSSLHKMKILWGESRENYPIENGCKQHCLSLAWPRTGKKIGKKFPEVSQPQILTHEGL